MFVFVHMGVCIFVLELICWVDMRYLLAGNSFILSLIRSMSDFFHVPKFDP